MMRVFRKAALVFSMLLMVANANAATYVIQQNVTAAPYEFTEASAFTLSGSIFEGIFSSFTAGTLSSAYLSNGTTNYSFSFNNGALDTGLGSLSTGLLSLAAGTYKLYVVGTGAFEGVITTSPGSIVPEPETYFMMLIGLAALFYASRNKANA